jgi:hypothetical protein
MCTTFRVPTNSTVFEGSPTWSQQSVAMRILLALFHVKRCLRQQPLFHVKSYIRHQMKGRREFC